MAALDQQPGAGLVTRSALSRFRQTQPTGTGPTKDQERVAKHDELVRVIAETRAAVMVRDRLCRACGQRPSTEMHEQPSRAKTRGKPPAERFNRRVCIGLCLLCHRDVTAHRMVLMPVGPERGFEGPIVVLRWLTGQRNC